MKTLCLAGLSLLLVVQTVHAQYTFGSEYQSTPSASLTYNSGANTFQYTDSDNASDDLAYLALAGSAATLITTSKPWTANLTVNLSQETLTSTASLGPHVAMGFGIVANYEGESYTAGIDLAQINDAGDTVTSNDTPGNTEGTLVIFSAQLNGNNQITTPGPSSSSYNEESYQQISGTTFSRTGSYQIPAATETLNLNFNSSTDTLTGSYGGINVGSLQLPVGLTDVTLAVYGESGEGIGVSSGEDLGSSFQVIPEPPPWALLLASLGPLAFLYWGMRRETA